MQILGCYNSYPLKMNLVPEIRTMLTQKAVDMFLSNPLLSTKDFRQSSEGYPTKVDWSVEVRVVGTGWWHKA